LHQFLTPFQLSTRLNYGSIHVECDTDYPFGSELRYHLRTDVPFDFSIRVPSWVTDKSTIESKGLGQQQFVPNSHGHFRMQIKPGEMDLLVRLDFNLRVIEHSTATVSIYRGPLLYSLDMAYEITSRPSLDWTDRVPLAATELYPHVHDHYVQPTDPHSWAVAIDPKTLRIIRSDSVDGRSEGIHEPLTHALSVAAVKIEWPETNGTAAPPPVAPRAIGDAFRARLVPYGGAKLHMAELPVLHLGDID
jgi:hypothetical protein